MYFSKYERRYNNIAHSHIWEHIIALHILRRRSEQSLTHLVCYKVKDSFGDDKRYCWRFMMREKKSESDKINFASCKHEPPNDREEGIFIILLLSHRLHYFVGNPLGGDTELGSSCLQGVAQVANFQWYMSQSHHESQPARLKKVSTYGLHPII